MLLCVHTLLSRNSVYYLLLFLVPPRKQVLLHVMLEHRTTPGSNVHAQYYLLHRSVYGLSCMLLHTTVALIDHDSRAIIVSFSCILD